MSFNPVKSHGVQLTIILLLSAVLSACGFRLSGGADLPEILSKTYVTGLSENDEFLINLRRQLEANDVELVEQEQATAVLQIFRRRQGNRVLSVTSEGKVREYEIYFNVSFDVKDTNKQPLLETQSVELTRDFVFDENDVLGKASEQALLFEDMQKDAIRQIIYRLQTIST